MKSNLITLFYLLIILITNSCVNGDYEQPVENPNDPKIVSRDVKCLGKLIFFIIIKYYYYCFVHR